MLSNCESNDAERENLRQKILRKFQKRRFRKALFRLLEALGHSRIWSDEALNCWTLFEQIIDRDLCPKKMKAEIGTLLNSLARNPANAVVRLAAWNIGRTIFPVAGETVFDPGNRPGLYNLEVNLEDGSLVEVIYDCKTKVADVLDQIRWKIGMTTTYLFAIFISTNGDREVRLAKSAEISAAIESNKEARFRMRLLTILGWETMMPILKEDPAYKRLVFKKAVQLYRRNEKPLGDAAELGALLFAAEENRDEENMNIHSYIPEKVIRSGARDDQNWKDAILTEYGKISTIRFDAELRFLYSMDERPFGNSFCPKISNFLYGTEMIANSGEVEIWINHFGIHVFLGGVMKESLSCNLSHDPSISVANRTVTVKFKKYDSNGVVISDPNEAPILTVIKFDSDEASIIKMVFDTQLDDWRYLRSGKKELHLSDTEDEIANFGEGSSGIR